MPNMSGEKWKGEKYEKNQSVQKSKTKCEKRRKKSFMQTQVVQNVESAVQFFCGLPGNMQKMCGAICGKKYHTIQEKT